MKVFSVIYRPDIDTYYLYDREGKRVMPTWGDPPVTDHGVRYGFSFHDDYNTPLSVIWGQFLNTVELDPECEYFRQAEMGTGNMQDILARVTSYWLDRGKAEKNLEIPKLVEWSRANMIDPKRHTKAVSKLYCGEAAIAAIETIFARYIELIQGRQFQNWGHYWPNADRIKILELRTGGMKFKDIAKQMGRTNAACRAQYGRIRRGEDDVTVHLLDWAIMRESLPMGMFPKRKQVKNGNSSEGE